MYNNKLLIYIIIGSAVINDNIGCMSEALKTQNTKYNVLRY